MMKNFTIETTVNNKNDRLYAKSSADIDEFVKTVHRRQKQCSFMYRQSPNLGNHLWFSWSQDPNGYTNDILVPAFEEVTLQWSDFHSKMEYRPTPQNHWNVASRIAWFECNRFFSVVFVENESLLSEWVKILQDTLCASVGNIRQRSKRLIEKRKSYWK